MNHQVKYYHDDSYHGFSSPEIIVPLLMELLNPQSVIDIGCGTGNFLSVFKKNGIKKVLGIDGKWARKDLLFRYLTEQEFIETDFEEPIMIEGKFDLALCLEVAEHIPEEFADSFVANLCRLSDVVVFSAAIPSQGGQSHVNEQ